MLLKRSLSQGHGHHKKRDHHHHHHGHKKEVQEPVLLAFEEHNDDAGTDAKDKVPLIIMHGLFGSSTNWKTLSKQYAKGRRVFALGLFNCEIHK